jgi:hypothetical protein
MKGGILMLAIIKLFFFSSPDPEVKRISERNLDLRARLHNHLV